jgi:O-antigen/teichoic acid export membrane protein
LQAYALNLLMAGQQSRIASGVMVVGRIVNLAAIVVTMLYLAQSALGFMCATLASQTIELSLLGYVTRRAGLWRGASARLVDRVVQQDLLRYSTPMFGFELLSMVHAFVDRYVITYLLPPQELGVYSALYNIAALVGGVLFGGVASAVVPAYMHAWHTRGRADTEALLTRTSDVLLVFTPAVIGGLWSVGEPLLRVLATDTYAQRAALLPIITAGIALSSSKALLGAGVQVRKRPRRLVRFAAEAAALNFAANVLAIPQYGIESAAVITVASYAWLAMRLWLDGRQTITIRFNLPLLGRALAYTAVMVAATSACDAGSPLPTLLLRLLCGSTTYAVLIAVFEADLRRSALQLVGNWRQRL